MIAAATMKVPASMRSGMMRVLGAARARAAPSMRDLGVPAPLDLRAHRCERVAELLDLGLARRVLDDRRARRRAPPPS